MLADGLPVKVVGEEIDRRFKGLHKDVTTVSVLRSEVRDIGGHGLNHPEAFLRIEYGKAPFALEVAIEFGEDGLHGDPAGLRARLG